MKILKLKYRPCDLFALLEYQGDWIELISCRAKVCVFVCSLVNFLLLHITSIFFTFSDLRCNVSALLKINQINNFSADVTFDGFLLQTSLHFVPVIV